MKTQNVAFIERTCTVSVSKVIPQFHVKIEMFTFTAGQSVWDVKNPEIYHQLKESHVEEDCRTCCSA